MDEPVKRPASLSRILARRIAVFALLAMVVQVAVVFADYYFDDARLAALMIESEATKLGKGVTGEAGGLEYRLPAGLRRYANQQGDYFARIRSAQGGVIYSNCDASCVLHLLPAQVNPPDFWSRLLRSGKPIAVAGGRSFEVGGTRVFVEVAVLDDHERVMWHVLAREFTDHLAVPMSLMLVFVVGGMLLSIRIALKPVEQAAREAEKIDPLEPSHRIEVTGMPREVADLSSAVNRTLLRVHGLMQAQRIYTAAVAHEVRTPLAMMKLELGFIDHPRARKIEGDVDALARFVGQITTLGRLEGSGRSGFRKVDLARIGRKVVTDIAPWIYDQQDEIAFFDAGAGWVYGQDLLLDDAVRNLVENAVRHTPPGTAIQVTAGPGPAISVRDDAGLFAATSNSSGGAKADQFGVGLQIVERIMNLHQGQLETSVEAERHTTMRMVFATASGGSSQT